MTAYRLGVLDGDGIGPEVVGATVTVLQAAANRIGGVAFDLVPLPMGWAAIEQHGEAMPPSTRDALAGCHGWIMGPHDSASYPAADQAKRNPSGELRHHFDLFANVRPARAYPGVAALAPDIDLVIVRENTEGFYPDRNLYAGSGEFLVTPDVALSVGVFTRRAAERIAHTAVRLARQRRRHVTIVHKANVIRLGTGLYLDVCREVAAAYPDVTVDDFHVDAMAAHLVRRAAEFDVIVTENMFGDILSDLTAELSGSLGLAPSVNAGSDRAMAQAAHGSAPDIAGRGIANPVGERHEDEALTAVAGAIEAAVTGVMAADVRTPDLGGDATTEAFTRAAVMHLERV
jgi:3-isopropylmalate dehydrogenase